MDRKTLLVTVLFTAIACSFSWRLGADASRAGHATLTSRLAQLESRLEQLETSRGGQTPLHQRSSGGRSTPPSSSRQTLDVMPPSDAASLAALGRQRESTLDARFRAVPADALGSAAVEASLRHAAGAAELEIVERKPEQLDVDCRRTACRIEARFTDAAEADTWLQAYLLVAVDSLAQAESIAHLNADGTARLTIYGTRR